jgi:hypothetical protein
MASIDLAPKVAASDEPLMQMCKLHFKNCDTGRAYQIVIICNDNRKCQSKSGFQATKLDRFQLAILGLLVRVLGSNLRVRL